MKTSQASRLITLIAATALLVMAGKSMAADCGSCCGDKKTTSTAALIPSERMVAEGATDDPVKISKAATAVKTSDAQTTTAYPLDTCPVTGAKLGKMGAPYVYNFKGREVRFCCSGCVKTFEKDSAKYLKQMDEAIVKKQKASYPLTTCVVNGDKLGGEMGEPIDIVYKNQLVRVCCSSCVRKFQKDPAKYLKAIDDGRKKAASRPTAAVK